MFDRRRVIASLRCKLGLYIALPELRAGVAKRHPRRAEGLGRLTHPPSAAPLRAGRAEPLVDILERALQQVLDMAQSALWTPPALSGQEQREGQPLQLLSLAAASERVVASGSDD